MLIDAHIHIHDSAFLESLCKNKVEMIVNISRQEDYEFLKPYLSYSHIHTSAGIHPWDNDVSMEQMKDIMNHCDVIGEIGMDNVWCDNDLMKQREVFEQQLAYAMEVKKPVILHTKGQERKILEIIQKYPNTYLVHWYSCLDYLDEYIKEDCYFTVGPALDDKAVKQVVKKVPLNRLLCESDGLNAIAWVKGKEAVSFEEYYETLKDSYAYIANVKSCLVEDVYQQLENNFYRFITKKP